jgi:hypothetical protein
MRLGFLSEEAGLNQSRTRGPIHRQLATNRWPLP